MTTMRQNGHNREHARPLKRTKRTKRRRKNPSACLSYRFKSLTYEQVAGPARETGFRRIGKDQKEQAQGTGEAEV